MPFPDVTALLVTHLTPIIAPTPLFVDVPDPRPDEFAQVRRIGGLANPPVRDNPHVDAITWAPTAQQAMSTLLTIRGELWALPGTATLGLAVYRLSEILGPKQLTDPETGSPMAIATFELQVRADNAIQFTQ